MKLYKFYWDCKRMGKLEGIFTAEEENIKKAIGREICFGEVLGKHSEIFGTLEEGEIIEITDDQDFIKKFKELKLDTGYNPLDYLEDEDD